MSILDRLFGRSEPQEPETRIPPNKVEVRWPGQLGGEDCWISVPQYGRFEYLDGKPDWDGLRITMFHDDGSVADVIEVTNRAPKATKSEQPQIRPLEKGTKFVVIEFEGGKRSRVVFPQDARPTPYEVAYHWACDMRRIGIPIEDLGVTPKFICNPETGCPVEIPLEVGRRAIANASQGLSR